MQKQDFEDNPLEPEFDIFNEEAATQNPPQTLIYEEYEFNTRTQEYQNYLKLKDRILFVYVIFVDLGSTEGLGKIDEQKITNYISRQNINSFVSLLPVNNPQKQNPAMNFPYTFDSILLYFVIY